MLKHDVIFEAGHDCIHFECKYDSARCAPGEGGSHGLHGLNIRFVVRGEEGAVVFLLYTGWLPRYTPKNFHGYRTVEKWGDERHMMPASLDYHAKVPRYEGQEQTSPACDYCDGQPCYCDGSGLNATDAMYALVNGGDEGIWKFLDEYYATVFRGGKYPDAVEYPKPLRKEN